MFGPSGHKNHKIRKSLFHTEKAETDFKTHKSFLGRIKKVGSCSLDCRALRARGTGVYPRSDQ